MRARSVSVSLILSGALLLASCGDDDGGGGGVAVDDYAEEVCDAFTSFQSDVAEAQEDLAKKAGPDSDPEDAKVAFEKFADEMVTLTESFAEAAKEAGTPDVDEGDEVAETLESAFDESIDRLEAFRDDVGDLDTDDPEQFQEDVDELTQELASGSNPFDAVEELNVEELEDALDDTECGDGSGDDDSGDDDSGDDDSGDDENAGSVDVETYANELCAAVQAFQSTIQEEQTELTTGLDPNAAPEDAKAALEGFIDGAVSAAQSFADDVDSAGIPDTEGGDEAAEALRDAIDLIVQRFEEAQVAIEELDTSDPAAFTEATQQIGADIQASFGDDPFENLDADELEEALDATPCGDGGSAG